MSTEDIAAIGLALETDGVEKGTRALDTLASKGPAVEKAMGQVEGAAKKTGKTLESLGSSSTKGGIEGIGKAGSTAADGIDRLGKAADRSQKDVSGLNSALRSSSGDARAAARSYADMAQSLESATRLAAGLFAGASFLGGVGKLVAVQREFDVLNSSLITVSGSAEIAAREFEWIEKFAKETPFGLAQATQGFVKMKALGLDPTRASLTSFGNTASAMGKDLNQMIEAVADASTGEFERLKEFGIKAKKEGESVSLTFQGVTTTIGNSAKQITKYLEDIGNNQFGGAMAQRAKTLDGAIAELGDTWDGLFRTVNERNAGTVIYDSVKLANGAIEDATTIVKALTAAYDEGGRSTGALKTFQEGIATVFETVAVLGVNLKYTLVGIGNEIGGLAAQAAQAAQFNFSGVAAIRRQMVADAEAARKEVDATTARILNARKEQERYASYATRNASAATDPRRLDLPGAKNGGGTGVGKPKKDELSEYDKLIQKLGQEIPKAAAEAEAAQMGYNKAQTEFLALAGSPLWASFTGQQRATVAALFDRKIASEQAGDAEKALAKANLEAGQTREKYLASLESGITKIRADITAQEEATARMGLTKQAVADLDVAKLEMLATDTELQAIKALDRNLDQQTYDSLKEQAKLYRDLAAAKRIGAAKETALEIEKANEEAARKAADDWQRTADDINRSLTDALLRGFESGKGFAKNFVDTMKNLFSTLVLRPVISAIVSPVAGAVTGALGLAAPAAAIASGGSALGTVGNLASGAGMLGRLGSGFANGLSAWGSGGSVTGVLSNPGLYTGAELAGALAPIALGIGALVAIANATKGETRTGGQFGVSFDGTVTNQRRGETYNYQGQQFDRDFSNGQRNALIAGQAYRLEGDPVQNEQAIRDAVSGTASGINAFLKALGSKATLTGFSAGLETSGKGRGGVFAGGILSDGTTFGESGKGDNYAGTLYEKFSTNSPDFKTALENFTLDLKQSTIQALQSVTDIPETVKKMLKGVDAEGLGEEAANALLESINAQIVGVQNLTSAFEAMGLDKLADMGFDAAAGLAAASGGFDKLQSNLNTYYDNFTTEDQKRANLQKQLDKQFAALGIDVPKNREEFSRLVESTLEQAEVQDKTRAALSKQINDAIAGAGQDGFTLADAGARSIVSGINPALLGNAEADPALAGKLDGFLSGVSDLAGKGLDPAAFQEGLSGLIAVNSEVLGIGKDASQTAAALLALSGTFAELNESADDAAARIAKEQADARDKALRGLERAIAKEKEALQTQIDVAQDVASTMSGLFDLLKSNVRELYGEVDSTRSMLAAQGNDFIAQALATARATGYLPDENQLADAIGAARGGLDSNGYTSQFEMDRDRLVLAGKLSELEGLTGKQLTSAERTVKELEAQSEQLDQTLDYWKEQIEIANGTYEATLSVVDAIKNLEALMFPKTAASDKGKGSAAGSVGGITWGGNSNVSDKYFTPGSYTGGTFYQGVSLEQEKRLDKYAAGYHAFDGTGDAAGLNQWIADNKLTPEDLAGLSGLYESDWERWYKANNIPAFAVGTNYVPRDMLAQIHEGEAIVPKAYNPAANPGMSGSGQTEALLTALLEQNARIETSLAAIEGHAQDTSRATNGNPISPVPVALVEDETV